MKQGLFITFEGGDGSGKSTQINRLVAMLEKLDRDVLVTREPGGTVISEKIRSIILDPAHAEMSAMTECMLYAAARAQLVHEVIRPALEQGRIVICDRFVDSSVAYQSYGRNLGEAVMQINRFGIEECMPDLTIYLRLDPEAGKDRISTRENDRIEQESDGFHRRVAEGYDRIAAEYPERIHVIDASGTIEEIARQIAALVSEKLHGLQSE